MSKKPSKRKKRKIFTLPTAKDSLPGTSRRNLYRLLSQGSSSEICDSLIEVFMFFQNHNFRGLSEDALRQLDEIVSAIFAIFADSNFQIPQRYAPTMISQAHLFSNMVTLSSYGTTDAVLQQVIRQQDNFVKILFLYTIRNKMVLDSKLFFDISDKLASLWFLTYPIPTVGCITPTHAANMRRHFTDPDPRYSPFDHRASLPYFYCTYFVGQERGDRKMKESLNASCRKVLSGLDVNIQNKPARDSIAIITSKWFPDSAVFKSCFPFLDTFRDKYRMTLLHTGFYEPHEDSEKYFDEVKHVKFQRHDVGAWELTTHHLKENDYQLAYFPDIGMTDESVWLSNLRIAPIQVTGYGHPVSTFGGEIDYFVVGEETEKLEDLALNYSETPIVMPGLGCTPVWPTYKRTDPARELSKVKAACVWGPDKYNHTMICALQEIQRRAPELYYEVFASRGVNRYNAFLPFQRDLLNLLGEKSTLHSDKEYHAYMQQLEFSDFTINSWPFGGYNTVVESLYLGKPVVTLEGDRFYNLAASALLRRVGLDNLITTNMEDFISLCAKMATDYDYRLAQQEKLASVDLSEVLFDTDEPRYFKGMMEYIIDNHDRLKGDKTPLIARELCST